MSSTTEVENLLGSLEAISAGHSRRIPATKYLDPRTRALVQVAAAICSDAPTVTLKRLVKSASECGASDEEVIGTLFAVASAAGETRLVALTPRISLALGYDIDEAFERE